VKAENASYYDEYPATVVALNQVDLRPEVSGYVTSIFVADGQHVRMGMKLYAIDQQQVRAAYDQALANLNAAKANMAKTRQDVDRYNELAKNDAVARQTLEHAQADLESARMQVAAAQAGVQNVQTNLRYSIIVAPFDGIIGISQVKLGSSVTAGQTVLNTMSSGNPMGVDVAVDEKQIGRFTRFLKAGGGDHDSTFTIVLPDLSVYPLPGRISFLDRAVDPQTGTIRVRMVFPNPRNELKPGLTCNLRVGTSAANSVLIPFRAVVEQMGEYSVFVVNGNKVSQKRITLGTRIRDMAVVMDGVHPGDQIVTEGVQRLKDNALVAVLPSGGGQGQLPGAGQPVQGGGQGQGAQGGRQGQGSGTQGQGG
jgi:membrane fusion protein (multidrug efflux system)